MRAGRIWIIALAATGTVAFALAGAASASHLGDGLGDFDIDEFEDARGLARERELCAGAFGDRTVRSTEFVSVSQDVGLDEDDVFLALALDDGDLESLRDLDRERTVRVTQEQDVDLDREEALSLLALGGDGFGGDLACVADVDRSFETRTSLQRDVDLDEDDVFASLAFGDDVGVFDVADFDVEFERTMDFAQDFDLDRDDAFTALLFG